MVLNKKQEIAVFEAMRPATARSSAPSSLAALRDSGWLSSFASPARFAFKRTEVEANDAQEGWAVDAVVGIR